MKKHGKIVVNIEYRNIYIHVATDVTDQFKQKTGNHFYDLPELIV